MVQSIKLLAKTSKVRNSERTAIDTVITAESAHYVWYDYYKLNCRIIVEIGQTILIAQGADGEQQCVYVAEDGDALGIEDGSNGVLTVDGSLVGE